MTAQEHYLRVLDAHVIFQDAVAAAEKIRDEAIAAATLAYQDAVAPARQVFDEATSAAYIACSAAIRAAKEAAEVTS